MQRSRAADKQEVQSKPEDERIIVWGRATRFFVDKRGHREREDEQGGDSPAEEIDHGRSVPVYGQLCWAPEPQVLQTRRERFESQIKYQREHGGQANEPEAISAHFTPGPQNQACDSARGKNGNDPK